MSTKRNEYAYTLRRDALKAKTRKLGLPCHLCLKPIRWDVDYNDPLAFSADHLTAVKGADKGNMLGPLAPAH